MVIDFKVRVSSALHWFKCRYPLSTLNRLMKVELALPATIAGFLIALHYAVQLTRVNWGTYPIRLKTELSG